MVVEIVVLDGHGGFLQPGIQVLVIHPDPVALQAGELIQHLILIGILIPVIDDAGLGEIEIGKLYRQVFRQGVLHIGGEDHQEQETGAYGNEHDREHDLQSQADHTARDPQDAQDKLLQHVEPTDVFKPFFQQMPHLRFSTVRNILYHCTRFCQSKPPSRRVRRRRKSPDPA